MTKVTRLTHEDGLGERRRLHLREVADDPDAPLDTVGADLSMARERRGLAIDDISHALKIKAEYLAALEDGDIAALPGRTYAIGFLRSYADYLGLDPISSVERFKAENAGRAEPEPVSAPIQMEAEQRKLPQGWIVFVVLLLVAVIWGGYYLSVSANRMLTQNVAPVPSTLARQAGIEQSKPVVSHPAPTTPTTPTTPAATPAAIPPAATAPAVAGTPAPAAPGTQVASVQPQTTIPPDATLPPGQQYGLMNKDHTRITIRVHRLTRLLIQGPSGTVYINRPLQPGDTYMAPNVVGMTATTDNADALEVILDGQPIGRLGKGAGNGISLNPQDLMDRASHHG